MKNFNVESKNQAQQLESKETQLCHQRLLPFQTLQCQSLTDRFTSQALLSMLSGKIKYHYASARMIVKTVLQHLKCACDGEEGENNQVRWIEPKYNRTLVRKAGKALIKFKIDEQEYSEALNVVNNWRASYAFPLNSVTSFLRKKANNIERDALISQRLKRIPSILEKLKRYESMSLDRMQDIGGCRVVFSDIKNVYSLRESLINSKTKNELKKEDDYIKNIKDSGYRGIHLIYKYNGKKDNIYNGHSIEIQIRTKIQHAWATSVEIVGIFTKESLKAGKGSEDWLNFFKLTSILFSRLESCTPKDLSSDDIIKIKNEVKKLQIELDVFKKLRAFSVSTQYITKVGEGGYFLLLLRVNEQKIEIRSYGTEDLEIATENYITLEKEYKINKEIDIVLVAAKSVKSLEKAYPNYFADSKVFLEKLTEVLR